MVIGVDKEDFSRIFRFFDYWGIINYCVFMFYYEVWSIELYLSEDLNGEVYVLLIILKFIDSLIKFDKLKCRLKFCDVYLLLLFKVNDFVDLDSRIRERLLESYCNCCFRFLLVVYY